MSSFDTVKFVFDLFISEITREMRAASRTSGWVSRAQLCDIALRVVSRLQSTAASHEKWSELREIVPSIDHERFCKLFATYAELEKSDERLIWGLHFRHGDTYLLVVKFNVVRSIIRVVYERLDLTDEVFRPLTGGGQPSLPSSTYKAWSPRNVFLNAQNYWRACVEPEYLSDGWRRASAK